MIARTWIGVTPKAKADEYLEYLMKTGVKDTESIRGNQGVYLLRRIRGEHAEFLFISLWDSIESISKFAGADPEKAVYYPEDKDFLLELSPKVIHYEVLHKPS